MITSTRTEKAPPSRGGGAALVAFGIMLSRVMGLIRQKIFAFYFGNSDLGDAFYAALKIPNFLQNLLGDGVLSASFIPVYAGLRAKGESAEADRVAGIIGALLAILNTLLVALGILTTPFLIDVIAPGFSGEKEELTILLVQIFFPGTGLLVMSAWCLGILNSHRRFFLSYAAPVIWNATIIVALVYYGSGYFREAVDPHTLVIYTSWSVFLGSALQFLIQVPAVLSSAPALRASLDFKNAHVRKILKNFLPVVTSRGVVQFSAYVDNIIASFLPGGAVSAMAYAQSLYMLPVSLFGMSVSAAQLPAMSSAVGTDEEVAQQLRSSMQSGLKQIAFFVIPSVVGFWCVGDVIVRALYLGGAFQEDGVFYVWAVLAGYTVGLLSSTMGRLFSSAFFAMKDTKTPLRIALIRVGLALLLGYCVSLYGPGLLGIEAKWGAAGLAASAGLAGWVEFLLLRRALLFRIGALQFPKYFILKCWFAALIAGSAVFYLKSFFIEMKYLNLLLVLIVFGLIYFAVGVALGLEEPKRFVRRFIRE